jgi:hypothetical protein
MALHPSLPHAELKLERCWFTATFDDMHIFSNNLSLPWLCVSPNIRNQD